MKSIIKWLLRMSVLGVVLYCSAAWAQQCVPPPAGLVGWWSGDGNTSDLSGNNLDGSIQGDGVSYAPGKVGLAFQFNNQNGKVVVPDNPLLRPTGALTVEAWVQPWAPPAENSGVVVDDMGYDLSVLPGVQATGGYWLNTSYLWNEPAFSVGVGISHGPCQPSYCGWDALYSGYPSDSQWHHLAGAYDATTGHYRFYVDGTDITGGSRDVPPPQPIDYAGSQPGLVIGNHAFPIGGVERGYYGLIDEVRVYNRALTEAEILAIYNADTAGVCKALPFKAFNVSAALNLQHNAFAVLGEFTLGAGSGIAPMTEAVKLDIGTFSTTIPAGSFKSVGKGSFTFSGKVNGVSLSMVIQLFGKGYIFAALGNSANLVGTANPVKVGLTIGGDTGSASIKALFL